MKKCAKKLTSLLLALAVAFSTIITPLEAYAASYPEWSASAEYAKGDKVSYNGKVYEAKWWTTNEAPGSSEWGAWVEVSDEGGEVTPNTPPTITGVKDQTISLGTAFNSMTGVTATDAEDGVITGKVVVTGTVNVNAAGSYPLTYTVTDNGGLTATASCTITVKDNTVTPPSNPIVSLSADKPLPTVGDKVRLTAAAASGTALSLHLSCS